MRCDESGLNVCAKVLKSLDKRNICPACVTDLLSISRLWWYWIWQYQNIAWLWVERPGYPGSSRCKAIIINPAIASHNYLMFNQPQRAPSANAFVTRIAGRKSVETYAESQQPLCPTNLTLLETILHYPVTVKKMFDIPNTDMCSFVSQEWPKNESNKHISGNETEKRGKRKTVTRERQLIAFIVFDGFCSSQTC